MIEHVEIGTRYYISGDERHGTVRRMSANRLLLVEFDTGGTKWIEAGQLYAAKGERR